LLSILWNSNLELQLILCDHCCWNLCTPCVCENS
jgi:hypothetical protein